MFPCERSDCYFPPKDEHVLETNPGWELAQNVDSVLFRFADAPPARSNDDHDADEDDDEK